MLKEIEAGLKFWNEAYKEEKPIVIKEEEYGLPKEMKKIFNTLLDNCDTLIDYGCGACELSLEAAHSGKVKKIYGIEKGENIVNFGNSMAKLNNLDNILTVEDGGIDALKRFADNSMDGIIISNVLDVVTKDVADDILKNLLRVLKKDGLIMLKLNQYVKPEDFAKRDMVNFSENLYSFEGVLRIRLCTTDEWRKWFSPYLKEEMYADVPYQEENFFDRLFLLRKK